MFDFVSPCIIGGRVKEGAWSLCVLADVFVMSLICICYQLVFVFVIVYFSLYLLAHVLSVAG